MVEFTKSLGISINKFSIETINNSFMNFSGYHCYKILENVDLKKIFGNSLANENDQFNVENVNSFWKNLFYTFISFLYDSSLV